MMHVSVPFQSQHALDIPEEWRRRSCGLASLKMALDTALVKEGRNAPGVPQLIDEALAIDGWTKWGWSHEALVRLAHNHGVPAYREEFRSVLVDAANKLFTSSPFEGLMLEKGIERLKGALARGLLPIVSIPGHFEEGGEFHLVILTGYGEREGVSGFLYNDSAYLEEDEGKQRFVDEATFRARWRKLAIIVG